MNPDQSNVPLAKFTSEKKKIEKNYSFRHQSLSTNNLCLLSMSRSVFFD